MKRVASIVLICCIGVGGLRWIQYEPCDTSRLFQPIPAYAGFVSLHDNFSTRWQEWSGNPLTQSLLHTAGVRIQDLENIRTDSSLQTLLSILAGDRTLFAYIPSLGISGQPGWVVTSRLGGRGAWLRWFLKLFPQESLVHVGNSRGVDLWMVERDGLDSMRMYFSLTRGMLVGCYAQDPTAQQRLLDLLDHRSRSWTDLADSWDAEQRNPSRSAPDRGWIQLPGSGENRGGEFALRKMEARHIQGWISGPVDFPLNAPLDTSSTRHALEQFSLPGALCWSMAAPSSLALILNNFTKVQLDHVALPSEVPLFLGMQGEDFSGRLFGMKIPSLMAALPVDSEAAADALINSLLDELNRAYQGGLVPRVSIENEYPLTLIDATVRTPYSLLSDENKAACLYRNGWLILASNAGALSKIAAWMDSGAEVKEAILPPADLSAQAHLWLDLAPLRATLPPIIQMVKFKLLLDRGEESKKVREQLSEAESWIKSFEAFDVGRISLSSQTNESIMDIELIGFAP